MARAAAARAAAGGRAPTTKSSMKSCGLLTRLSPGGAEYTCARLAAARGPDRRTFRPAGVVTAIHAPVGDIGRRRKPLRLGHVLMTLEHMLIVTWRVPEAELRRHLPAALQPV